MNEGARGQEELLHGPQIIVFREHKGRVYHENGQYILQQVSKTGLKVQTMDEKSLVAYRCTH